MARVPPIIPPINVSVSSFPLVPNKSQNIVNQAVSFQVTSYIILTNAVIMIIKRAHIIPDITPNVISNIRLNINPIMTPNITPNITSLLNLNIHVFPNAILYIYPNIPPHIIPSIQSRKVLRGGSQFVNNEVILGTSIAPKTANEHIK